MAISRSEASELLASGRFIDGASVRADRSARGAREISLLHSQLINPMSKVEFDGSLPPPFELR